MNNGKFPWTILRLFRCGTSNGDEGRRWVFSLKELRSATNSFNFDNKLGGGQIGSVYWGQLPDGSQIVVKRLKVLGDKNEEEFAEKVEILGKVKHRNLLSVRGYCAEGQERILVYDYLPNSSLQSHLHGAHSHDGSEPLIWSRRMSIAIGAARGIAFLHGQATPKMIHADIRSSNVLLDVDFQPKVADFGLSSILLEGVEVDGLFMDNLTGYLAPECVAFHKVTASADVYSFGILLLELVSGKKPLTKKPGADKTISIRNWAVPLATNKKFGEIADPKLNGQFVESELRRLVLVALACSQKDAEIRPSMPEVVSLLKGDSREKLMKLEDSVFATE